MKYKISAKNDSVVNAGITTDYRQAIAEYIWNGFDAGAQTVRLDYVADDMYKSYGFAPHWADFNRIKENFVKSIPSLIQH